jgi:hypothetical protein
VTKASALGWIGLGVLAVVVGCSKTPTFVDDAAGRGGAGGATTSTGTTATTSTTATGTGGATTTTTAATCKVATDCPGVEDECAHRSCEGGHCAMAFAAAGYAISAQTGGDCAKIVCDGKGGQRTDADDTDVPSDGNPCTVDTCEAGAPKHAPAAQGTACGADQKLACDGQGTCAGCKGDADCGASSACAKVACNVATTRCELTYVPSGQGDPGNQTPGDCKKLVCNGGGGLATVPDDGDLPDDGNACTADLCSGGVASHAPAPAGAPCAQGSTCDGKGSCSGCAKDTDCGQSNACASFACTAGKCSAGYVPFGQGNPGVAVGPCKKSVCDGSGGATSIADDGNLPVDGNPCTADACQSGVASNPPLPAGTSCNGNLKCDGAGSCKGCIADGDCGASTACELHRCVNASCTVEHVPDGTGCGGPNVCSGGACVCSDPGACSGKCGVLSNACGAQVDCGNPCGAPSSRGGGGVANQCGCSDPNACGGRCGSVTNACGAQVDCGGCPAPQSCGGGGVANQCGCSDPNACSGKCGALTNACGVQVDCGNPCVAPQTCGGGGAANQCGCTPDPDPCTTLGYECGTAPDGCGAKVDCAGCGGNICKNHICQCGGLPCFR